jgi:hypothetical protein
MKKNSMSKPQSKTAMNRHNKRIEQNRKFIASITPLVPLDVFELIDKALRKS